MKKRYVPGIIPEKELKNCASQAQLDYVMSGLAIAENDKPNALYLGSPERVNPAFQTIVKAMRGDYT